MEATRFSQQTVAAFDLDGTLTTRDCVVPFLRSIVGTRALVGSFAGHPLLALRAAVRGDRHSLKSLAVGSLAGRDVDGVTGAGERFAADVIPGWIRSDTLARLRQHLRANHRVVLVSASLAPYVHPLARQLGAEAALCCELETSSGLLTGRLRGQNCRGPEKLRRLRDWLGDGFDATELWAYGDSAGDDEMLAAATHPVRVNKHVLVGEHF